MIPHPDTLGTNERRAVPGTHRLWCQYLIPHLTEFPMGYIQSNAFRNSCIKITTRSSSNWIFTKFKLTEWTRPYFKAVLLESLEIIYLKLWSQESLSEPAAKSHCCDYPYLQIGPSWVATLGKYNTCLMPPCLPTIASDFRWEYVMCFPTWGYLLISFFDIPTSVVSLLLRRKSVGTLSVSLSSCVS